MPGTLAAAEVDLAEDARLVFSPQFERICVAHLISGARNIEVTLGTTILTSDNADFAGTVTIGEVIPEVGRGGVLQLGAGGATGEIGGAIVNDNQLVINRTGSLTLAGVSLEAAGSLTQNGSVTT